MKSFLLYFRDNFPMWLFGSLAVLVISLFFIFAVDASNVLDEEGNVLFGWKAFHLFSLLLMLAWMVLFYSNRRKGNGL